MIGTASRATVKQADEDRQEARLLLEEAAQLRKTVDPRTDAQWDRNRGATEYAFAVRDYDEDQQRARDLVAVAQVHATLALRVVQS